MAISRTKKRNKRKLTSKQKMALEYKVEKGGTDADALRHAKYSKAVINNPSRVFQSSAFAQALEAAGVTDMRTAKKYSRLMDAGKIEHETLFGVQDKDGKWKYPSRESIRKVIEGEFGETGCTLKYVQIDHTAHHVIATYWHPENAVQMGMIREIGKSKGHFAPDQLEITRHHLTEEEERLLKQMKVI